MNFPGSGIFDMLKLVFGAIFGIFLAKKAYDIHEEKEDLKDEVSYANAEKEKTEIKVESVESENKSLKDEIVTQEFEHKIDKVKVEKPKIEKRETRDEIHYTVRL